MKGPMTTQTLHDIIGHEPFHWRGDRAGIEAFNPAFEGLLGDDAQLTPTEMQAFENFLATITFPPNPNRKLDNTLPSALPLAGHYTSGRFAMSGLPLGVGNAVRGLDLYTRSVLDTPFQCASCHSLPTGMAVNGPLMLGAINFSAGGSVMAMGPMGENHLGIVSVDGSTNTSIKTPQLRNQYEKVGFDLGRTDSSAGFGFLHDGSVDSLSRFISARTFSVQSDQDVADLVALMLSFAGSDFPSGSNPLLGAPPPLSRDSHAAVGAQVTLTQAGSNARADELLSLARGGKVGLIARRGSAGYAFVLNGDQFLTADGSAALTVPSLLALASPQQALTLSVVPVGLERRLGIDRDGDGLGDASELRQGSNPADAASTTLRPAAGLWYNPQRSGHGLDLELTGNVLSVTWYTYQDDGTPTWYLASAAYANPWVGDLKRYTHNAAGGVSGVSVGSLALNFTDARNASLQWQLGTRGGTEALQQLATSAPALPDRTGIWYDPLESGWGLSIYSGGDVRSAVLYFYDGDNQPRWVLGVGTNAAVENLGMQSYRGFCPDCAAIPTTATPGGRIDLNFSSARTASLTTDAFYAGQPAAPWRRGPVAIAPLSDAVVDPALW